MNRPLEGIIALDFSQYLAGPSAALRLADLGARVIKVENPKTGDSSRHLSLKNMVYDGDSVNFQAINRDKESFAANLKDPEDLKLVKALVKKADVLIENFRPGIMAKFGLDYESASVLNPRLVYATVTGYGTEGPWKSKPGQDLLLQSMSGLAYTNGNGDQPPTPLGISMADTFAGNHMVDGILACLVRRSRTGKGGRVEVSLLESILYLQLEGLTTYLNNGHKPPVRSRVCNAHPNVPRPTASTRPPMATLPSPWALSAVWVTFWAALSWPPTPMRASGSRSAMRSRPCWLAISRDAPPPCG